ncbi:MerR family transcriptional regulator [Minwuia sp.]|uniref:MerR family transcriptional regulator n=1 Tax=Minwuia sp. TaxID=2493630 RepID=UPI003A8E142E
MTITELSIGQIAALTECKPATIRYYEKIGLLPEPRRSPGNTRIYDQTHLGLLRFIRNSREMGFSQKDVRELLDIAGQTHHPCADVTKIAKAHLEKIDLRIARMSALRSELEETIQACDGELVANCRIVEALANSPQKF